MSEIDIFNGHGIEVLLEKPDDFLKIKETLTRIGVPSKKEKILYQSCHILHKRGRYAIVHFKEIFSLDGKSTDIIENDLARRNTITSLLQDWGLVKLATPFSENIPMVSLSQLKILSHGEKADWQLLPKYSIGKKSSV